MIRVKICGVTTPEDARLAAELGASAIGMVFWPHSPRAIDVSQAREIVAALPPFVAAVGVFVNQMDDVPAIADAVGLDVVQLHGDESPAAYGALRLRTVKAIGTGSAAAVAEAAAVPERTTVLLDAHDPERRGGTGKRIDWQLAAGVAARRPVILSGGLDASNVLEAIAAVKPYAIDVSSGVESALGRKDHAKLREFFAALRHSAFDIHN